MDDAITVIIPVRDMADQLTECLTRLMGDLGPHDVVVVVDDASSTDGVQAVCERLGPKHLRLDVSHGPYVARHLAAAAAQTPYLLFVDARCRPHPGLLDAHRRLLGSAGAALSATETRTLPGSTYASRVAEFKRPFTLDGKVFEDSAGARLSFFPTANLGVRADAYRAVGGFRRMRSGADADLCWRIQLAGLGRLAATDEVLMSWVPRTRWRQIHEQWARYGDSSALLAQLYPGQSPGSVELPVTHAAAVRAYARRLRTVRPRELPLAVGAALVHRSYTRGFRAGLTVPPEEPTTLGPTADRAREVPVR